MIDAPRSDTDDALWFTGKLQNKQADAIESRTLTVASRWSRIVRLTDKKEKGQELELDIEQLLTEHGEDVYFVRDGVACKAKFLFSKNVQLV